MSFCLVCCYWARGSSFGCRGIELPLSRHWNNVLICGWSKPWPRLVILLITGFMVSNRLRALWITVPLSLPSQYLKALLATPHTGTQKICLLLRALLWFHFLIYFQPGYLPWLSSQKLLFLLTLLFTPPTATLFSSVAFQCQLSSGPGLSCGKPFCPLPPLLCFLPVSTWLLCWLMKL